MFLISIKAEYEHRIKKILRTKNANYKVDIFTEDDIYDKNNYSKYKYIITDYNKDVVEYFLNLGKKVIIIDDDEVPISSQFFRDENVVIIKDVNKIPFFIESNSKKINLNLGRRTLFRLSLVTIMIFAFLIAYTLSSNINLENNKKTEQEEKEKEESKAPVEDVIKSNYKKENYVFLGDSITDYYNLEDYYKGIPVVNSGISGNQYKDLINSLESRVYKYNPTKVFLLIGTNDLAYSTQTNEELANHIMDICNEIHKNRENTEIYVESIYPVNRRTDNNNKVNLNMVKTRNNNRIKEVNSLIERKAKENNYNYIDMYSLLTDEEGDLAVDYTIDGLHISEKGYEIITNKIKKIIEGE